MFRPQSTCRLPMQCLAHADVVEGLRLVLKIKCFHRVFLIMGNNLVAELFGRRCARVASQRNSASGCREDQG